MFSTLFWSIIFASFWSSRHCLQRTRHHNTYYIRVIIITIIIIMIIFVPVPVKVSKGGEGEAESAFGDPTVSYVPTTKFVLRRCFIILLPSFNHFAFVVGGIILSAICVFAFGFHFKVVFARNFSPSPCWLRLWGINEKTLSADQSPIQHTLFSALTGQAMRVIRPAYYAQRILHTCANRDTHTRATTTTPGFNLPP